MRSSDNDSPPESPCQESLEQIRLALAETRALYHVSRSLIGFDNLDSLLQAVVDSVAQALPANRVTLITFDTDARTVTHFVKGGPGVSQIVETAFEELWEGLSGWALREIQPALSTGSLPDPRESPDVQRRRTETNCGAIIVVPLHYQNKISGTMTAINCPDERDFTQRDVELMMAMAGQSAVAIENARLFTELQLTRDSLERRVVERTAELTATNQRLEQKIAELEHTTQALRVSEQKLDEERNLLRTLIDTIPDYIYIKNRASRFVDGNDAVARALRREKRDDFIGKIDFDFHPPERAAAFYAQEQNLMQTGIPMINKEELLVLETGEHVWLLTSKMPWYNRDGVIVGLVGMSRDITARRHAEEALRESEKQYRLLADNSIDMISRHTLDGTYLYASPACRTLLGYAPEELVGHSAYEFFYPDDVPQIRRSHTTILDQPVVTTVSYRIRRKDGDYIWFESSSRTLRDSQTGTIIEIQAASRDITERKRAEGVLRLQNEYLTALHETSLAIMNRLNSDDVLGAVLSRAIGLVGTDYGSIFLFSPDKTTLTAVIYTGYPRDLPLRHATLGKGLAGTVWETGQTVVVNDYQNWHNRSFGIIPNMIRANLGIPLKSNEALIGILCVDYHEEGRVFSEEDITLLTRFAELASIALDNALLYSAAQQELAERRQVEQALQRSARRLSILHDIDRRIPVASSPRAIADVVLRHLVQLIPCEWASIVLYNADISEEQVFALHHTADIEIQVGKSQPVVPNQVLERLKSGQSVVTADLRLQAGPKAQLAEDLQTQGIRSAMANPLMVQARLMGVLALASLQVDFFTTEHQQIAEEIAAQVAIALHQAELHNHIARQNAELEQRVSERTAQLENANRELEAFSYSVSHDLRTPLRAIQGFAEIIAMRHRDSLNDEGRHYFDNIVIASEQMNWLITDLLDYARLGRQRVRFEVLPVGQILLEVMESLVPQVEKSGAQIHLADNLPSVLGDRTLLKRIFTNLLENALVYHRPGAVPDIHIAAHLDEPQAVIRVSDNGIGIPVEFHEKIFNIFQRLHSSDEYPGTGIGLAIVRKSAEMLNGSVHVESHAGAGSVFSVSLPYAVERE